LAVWSRPDVNGSGNPLQVKLGGTGLGLIALVSIDDLFPGFVPIKNLRALGRFIVYMQKTDGSFYSKYIPSMGGRQPGWQSLYYPGEAALGLLMLYGKDPSEVWLRAAYRVLEYLARERRDQTDIPADHWALLATDKLLSYTETQGIKISRDVLIRHAVQICNTILNDQIINHEHTELIGGFTKDGRTTPAATRLEGLIAASSFIPADVEIHNRFEKSISLGISFLLRAQVKTGRFTGAIPRAVIRMDGMGPEIEKVNKRATEIRMDYIQHGLSAMLQSLHQTH
jgi:hypothetical protein